MAKKKWQGSGPWDRRPLPKQIREIIVEHMTGRPHPGSTKKGMTEAYDEEHLPETLSRLEKALDKLYKDSPQKYVEVGARLIPQEVKHDMGDQTVSLLEELNKRRDGNLINGSAREVEAVERLPRPVRD